MLSLFVFCLRTCFYSELELLVNSTRPTLGQRFPATRASRPEASPLCRSQWRVNQCRSRSTAGTSNYTSIYLFKNKSTYRPMIKLGHYYMCYMCAADDVVYIEVEYSAGRAVTLGVASLTQCFSSATAPLQVTTSGS